MQEIVSRVSKFPTSMIIFWISSIFSQIGSLTVELAALEHLKSLHRFILALM